MTPLPLSYWRSRSGATGDFTVWPGAASVRGLPAPDVGRPALDFFLLLSLARRFLEAAAVRFNWLGRTARNLGVPNLADIRDLLADVLPGERNSFLPPASG